MKSTGVIRRIDELGRIVIPKEIRRNLGIHDGENVEIYTENDFIILKKHNRLSTLSELANKLSTIIYNEFNYKTIITDREKIITTKGIQKKLENLLLPPDYLKIIEEREIKKEENYTFKINNEELTGNFIFIPIISLNDSIGLIIMYSDVSLTNELAIGKLISHILANKLEI